KKPEKKNEKFSSGFASWVVILAVVAGLCIYKFIFGDPQNFIGGDHANGPVQGGTRQYLGIIYEGGFVVPILLSLVIMTITFSIERYLTISKASGKTNVNAFIGKIRAHLRSNNIDAAIRECDTQRGSVANVVKSTLFRYKEMEAATHLDVDQRILSIQQEVEESTNLELPMLEKNLVILATMGSVSTLVALFGTVLGMIRAFAALGTGGAPDSSALAV